MAKYCFTPLAENDLFNIADYTIEQWGIKQARTYRDKLNSCFTLLADRPTIGRDASEYGQELRRYAYQSHTIFYVPTDTGILIVRVLGQQMDYEQHL